MGLFLSLSLQNYININEYISGNPFNTSGFYRNAGSARTNSVISTIVLSPVIKNLFGHLPRIKRISFGRDVGPIVLMGLF
jgi:hypothetical protein